MMAGSRHRPWFRRALLAANVTLPPVMIVAVVLGWGAIGWIVAGTFAVHGLLVWAVFNPRCEWLGPVVSRFRAESKGVWLTVDDGPDGARTLELSQWLHARGVRATFFVIGERASRQPEVVRALREAGHEVANHSATHPRLSFWRHGLAGTRREVGDGVGGRRFRAPAGHKPVFLHRVMRERGMRLVAWTVGGRDGWRADPSPVVGRVLSRAAPGAIVMLHEGRKYSVATIMAVVEALLANGFTFTIPEGP
jgi:peptidoglycan-N-acetylglucosamine deacetylase